MKLRQLEDGRLSLQVLAHADWDVARRLAQAITETFRGRRGQYLSDFDGGYLDIEITGVAVMVNARHQQGVHVTALSEAANPVVCNVANYLGANAAKLGIEMNE